MPKIIDCEQGSAEWLQARCGRITASRLSDVTAYLKSGKGEMKARADYRMDLVAERLTGLTEPYYVSPEMKWGTKHEPMARALYEVATGAEVDQIGFALHPVYDFAGASPDALVGSDGGLEIKCPKTTTHLAYMMAGEVPEEYRPQMYWNMVCCERLWWDFVSYCPKDPIDDERLMLPDHLRLFVKRLYADQDKFSEIEEAATATIEEAVALVKKLSSRMQVTV